MNEKLVTEEEKENVRKILALKIASDEDYLRFLELTDAEIEDALDED